MRRAHLILALGLLGLTGCRGNYFCFATVLFTLVVAAAIIGGALLYLSVTAEAKKEQEKDAAAINSILQKHWNDQFSNQ